MLWRGETSLSRPSSLTVRHSMYFKQQALFAEHALKAGNLAVFHKHVQRIFKEQQGSSSAAPTAVLGGADGKQLFQSREEVVKCFAEHFADVLNCPAKLDQQMQQTIEELVQKMEAGQGANQQQLSHLLCRRLKKLSLPVVMGQLLGLMVSQRLC